MPDCGGTVVSRVVQMKKKKAEVSFIVCRYCLHQRLSTELPSAEFVAQGVVSERTPCIPMTRPGPGWRFDVFLYRSADEQGVLFLSVSESPGPLGACLTRGGTGVSRVVQTKKTT